MNNTTVIRTNSNISVKDLVISGLLIALVFVSTYFIQFHLPISLNSGGLVHLGNVTLFSIAIVFGKKKGAIAGAFGMGLFDIVAGWTLWAPCTFVVRGVQGYIIGRIANSRNKHGNSMVLNIVAVLISSVWMLAGYFVYNVAMTVLSQAEGASLSTKLTVGITNGLSSIPGDLLQTGFGILGVLFLVPALKSVFKNVNL